MVVDVDIDCELILQRMTGGDVEMKMSLIIKGVIMSGGESFSTLGVGQC